MGNKRKIIVNNGDIFGLLTIIESVPRKGYLCLCNCGNKIIKSITELRVIGSGKTFGCRKCYKQYRYYGIDLTNKKFGNLIVVKKMQNEFGKIPNWEAICVCGTKIIRSQKYFTRKKAIKSCGCLKDKLLIDRCKKRPGESAFNALLGEYKNNAKKRSLFWDLTEAEFSRLINQNCYYCDAIPSNIKKNRKSFYIYNGIDRCDNSLGYNASNCVTCCFGCNNKKRAITIQIVKKVIELIQTGNPYPRPMIKSASVD